MISATIYLGYILRRRLILSWVVLVAMLKQALLQNIVVHHHFAYLFHFLRVMGPSWLYYLSDASEICQSAYNNIAVQRLAWYVLLTTHSVVLVRRKQSCWCCLICQQLLTLLTMVCLWIVCSSNWEFRTFYCRCSDCTFTFI